VVVARIQISYVGKIPQKIVFSAEGLSQFSIVLMRSYLTAFAWCTNCITGRLSVTSVDFDDGCVFLYDMDLIASVACDIDRSSLYCSTG